MSQPKAIIIGAGVGGLATAALLGRSGYAVEIYESRHQVGGRAGEFSADGFRFDTGPSWYLMPDVYQHFFELLDEAVADHLDLIKLDPAYQVFYDYRSPITIAGDLSIDMATFETVEPGAADRLQTYIADSKTIYDLAKQHFLYNPFRDYRTLLQPDIMRQAIDLTRSLLQPLHSHVKNRFASLALQQILEYPSVFLGTSPFDAPSMYRLMSYLDMEQGVFYPQGGLYQIVRTLQALAKKQGAVIHLNSPVSGIDIIAGKAAGITLQNDQKVSADLIVSNADLHLTDTVLTPQAYRSYAPAYWQKKTVGPSALLLYLGVRGKLPQLTHHNLLFSEAWQENFEAIYKFTDWPDRPSIYFCRPGATDPTVAPAGMENLFVLVPLPANEFRDAHATEAYADHCLKLIARHCAIPDLLERIVYRRTYDAKDFEADLHSWQGSALGLSHLLKQSAMFRPSNRSKKVSNLYYVGGDVQPGIGLPMCLISAELVLKHIHGDRSAGPLDNLQALRS